MPSLTRGRGVTWLAAGMCASACVLTWYGYGATRQWQRSSVLLAEQRAMQTADLLVLALTRDMQAVQRSVLPSSEWDRSSQEAAYDLTGLVASAFARYPYPEAFFATHGKSGVDSLLFFTRSDRPPPWSRSTPVSNQFPVTVLDEPRLASAIVEHVKRDEIGGRRFAIFGLFTDEAEYQIVVHLRYHGAFRDHLDDMFGFMVNMAWARQHYFQELTSQVARTGGTASGLALSVVDAKGVRVASTQSGAWVGQATRPFPLTFFDPLLLAVAQPNDLARQQWTVQVGGADDPALAAAIRGADRTLVIAAVAVCSLALGMMMTARAIGARDRLVELRSEFVSTVTHELKTPIATIRALGDTLVSGRVTSKEGQREYAELVVQEAKRLTRLIDNLLALSRITDVAEVYWFEPLMLQSVVERTMSGFESQMKAAGFRTRVDIPSDLPPILGDRIAVGLMLDNLVDNAIRYSPTERSLRISACREDGRVVLQVADRGRGIPHDEVDQATRKFFRGHDVGANGSGLGLAIVKRIVEDHRGRLTISSRAGEGTTVSVALPIDDKAEANHADGKLPIAE
jgi:signal transduction histidine kinase